MHFKFLSCLLFTTVVFLFACGDEYDNINRPDTHTNDSLASCTECPKTQPEVSYISDINELISCTEYSNLDGTINENLTIVARNETRTHALIIHEQEGYYALGGHWENGGFDNPNLTVELHSGVNVGINDCTETMMEEDITEIFLPIDGSEVPENLETSDVIKFSYGVGFPECEGCSSYAMVHLENFWFKSQDGNYAMIERIDYLQSDVTIINIK